MSLCGVMSEDNVLQLGDVAKKHTQIIELLLVRKAQNQL